MMLPCLSKCSIVTEELRHTWCYSTPPQREYFLEKFPNLQDRPLTQMILSAHLIIIPIIENCCAPLRLWHGPQPRFVSRGRSCVRVEHCWYDMWPEFTNRVFASGRSGVHMLLPLVLAGEPSPIRLSVADNRFEERNVCVRVPRVANM